MKFLTQCMRAGLILMMLVGSTGIAMAGIISASTGEGTFIFPNPLPVNTGNQTLPVPVTLTASGQIATVEVLTQGKMDADYTAISGGTCTGQSYTAGQSCTLPIRFGPLAPGGRRGAILLLDANGVVLATQMLYGQGVGSLGVLVPATIQTVAGNGSFVYKADGVPATTTPIYLPGGVAIDGLGNIFISDSSNHRIRRVDAVTGLISTVAGTGSPGADGDNGPATAAEVNLPNNIVIDGAGNLLFVDSGNDAVRRYTLATGVLSTIAGQLGVAGKAGDGGLATAALLNTPEGIALDSAGNIYIADTFNSEIRRIDAVTGLISTVAGTGTANETGDGGPGTSATLNEPWGLAMDASDNLYIADIGSNTIRRLSAGGMITTVAGTGSATFNGDNQPSTSANLKGPAAVAVDVAGNLYIADSGNNLIRKVAVNTGTITTVAGTGSAVFEGDGGQATLAGMYGPYALALDASGNLFLSDIFHHRIRELQNSLALLKYAAIKVGGTSPSQAVPVENDGNATLNFSALAPDNNSALDPATTTCAVGTPLAIDATCVLGAEFAPQAIGAPVVATIQARSDASNSPVVVSLTGESDALEPTTTTVTADANPAALGATVTFTAQVTGGGTAPNGNIRFYDGSTLLATVSTGTLSSAIFQSSSLTLGTHVITANFTGDTSNSPSTSLAINEVIKQTPAVALAASANPAQVGASVTFTATVSAPSVMPGGTVVFSDGTTVLGNGTLNTSGVATFATTKLAAGTHAMTAAYAGDTNTLAGLSAALSEVVNKWSTTTTLSSSSPTDSIGTGLTFAIHVATTSSVAPTGAVTLTDGATPIATLTLDGSGNASYQTSSLTVGAHTLTASFSADATNDTSTSSALTQTVQQIGTTTALVSSANPASAGAVVHLIATVTPASTNTTAGALTGTVTFMDGAVTLGAGNLSAAGVATFDVSSLSVSTHTLTAVYPGSANYGTSTSSAVAEIVQLATTTVQLTSSANPSIAGKGITLTAVVSGSGGVPGRSVTFLNGGTALGTVTVGGSGQANLTVATLPTGSQTLTASYSGDAKDNPSTSSALSQVISQATTAIVLTSSANPSFAGAKVTYLATLTSNGGLPSGQIVLTDGGNAVGSTAMSGTGVASFVLDTLTAGSHTLVASFAGDADHAASSSPALVQVVQTGTSVTALSSSANPNVFGNSITFNVAVTGTAIQPTGTVALMDGGTPLTTVTLNGAGVASFATSALSIGDHALTAVYSGDVTHAGSTSAVLTERVQQATTATISSSENPSVVGDLVKLTAVITGANGAAISGTVNFSDGAASLGMATVANGSAALSISTLTAGTHLIVATYSGDATNTTSVSAALSQTVNTAGTTVTLSSNANPSVTGSAVIFSASVSSLGRTATGTVTFMDGTTQLGTGTVTNGIATFTTSSLTAGQHAIVARYGGDAGTQVSTSSALLQVTQNKTGIALVSSVNPAQTLQGIVLTATVSKGANATGVVTFTDGGAQIGSLSLDASGTAVLTLPSLSAGSHTLVASYSGDSFNLPSSAAAVTETVQLRATTTSMTSSSDTYVSGQQITLVGVVHATGPVAPTGTVTFTSGTMTFGSAPVSASGAATLSVFPLADSYDIIATYSGDPVYSGSAADKYSIKAGPSTTFTMNANPTTFSMASGAHTTIDLTIASVKGFTDMVTLGCLELPADATCTFSSDKSMLAADGTNVVHLTIDTGNPLGIGATAKVKRTSLFGDMPRAVKAGMAFPAALLLSLMVWWARRSRTMPRLLALFVLIGMGLGMTSCANSLSQAKTPAGSYTIRVVASGAQSGASQVSDLAVTVTQ